MGPYFGRHPREIRDKIWSNVVQEPGSVYITWEESGNLVAEFRQPMPLPLWASWDPTHEQHDDEKGPWLTDLEAIEQDIDL